MMTDKLRAWFALSRPPFHLVGVLPFVLGSELAWRQGKIFRWDIGLWGVLGVVFIMLATYYGGEYWDCVEDGISARTGRSPYSGGSQVIERGLLPRRAALWGALVSLCLAGGVGLVLWLGYRTGPWTIPFGVLGMVGGFFYSARPLRWVSRGWGELWIAFCYGWLPVAVGYYLQTGKIAPLVHWLALPIGLTIFNVILLNEFPDYDSDRTAGKGNLTVRLGRERAAYLYGIASLGSWVAVIVSLRQGVPGQLFWLYLPVLVLSLLVSTMVLSRRWHARRTLERLCAANLLVNLATTAAYIVVFWFWR